MTMRRGRAGLGQSSPDVAPSSLELVAIGQLPPWLWPPVDWQNIDLLDYVALPAIAGQATILSFQVPEGYNGVINKVGNNFVGGGWEEGSGSVTWQILVDGTAPPGAVSYNEILGSLGSPANPTQIAGFRIFELQTLLLVVNNVSIVVAGQLAGGRLCGYLYPVADEEADVWT